MEFETVRKPIGTIRNKVERFGATWAKESRTLGAAALRTSAQRLASTAEKLDGLAARLEPADELGAALAAEAAAEPSLATNEGAKNEPVETSHTASPSTESTDRAAPEASEGSTAPETSSTEAIPVAPTVTHSENGKRRVRR
jgi:hypothetical protein